MTTTKRFLSRSLQHVYSSNNITLKESPDSTIAPRVSGFPSEVMRHSRFLSDWESNILTIDVRHFQSNNEKLQHFDLNRITITGSGDHVGIYKRVIPLTDFPEFIEGLKWAVNSTLTDFHHGTPGQEVGSAIALCQNFFSWLIQRGIYRLRDCNPEDLKQLLNEVARGSWHRINSVNRHLIQLGLKLRTDPRYAQEFVGKNKGATFRVNLSRLSQEIGLPLGNFSVSWSFRRRLAAITQSAKIVPSMPNARISPTFGEVSATAHLINRLALAPPSIDSISFLPFQSPNAAAKALIEENRGQTPNISTRESARVLSECLDWIYGVGPALAEVLEIAQSEIALKKDCREVVASAYNERVSLGSIPGKMIDPSRGGMQALINNISVCMAAAGCVVATNNGRRANEIFGVGKPYGAYYGCVEKVSDLPRSFQAEFYVEKGPQEFRSFPANTLVADAIHLMERFYVLFLSPSEEVPEYTEPRSLSRSKKLFRLRKIGRNGFGGEYPLDWRLPFRMLLSRANVNAKIWNGQHAPFRRLYATLFIHRYDMPEFPALQHQLGQLTPSQAVSYAYDNAAQSNDRLIRNMHRRGNDFDTKSMLNEISAAANEYLIELIEALLADKPTGGMFPQLLLKLAKRLSASSDFSKLTAERKAEKLAAIATKRGYSSTPLPHTVCMAGTARHALVLAKCSGATELQRESASPSTCSGCINSLNNNSYIGNVRKEVERLKSEAAQADLPGFLRIGLQKDAAQLQELIDIEMKLTTRTASALASLTEVWQRHLSGEGVA